MIRRLIPIAMLIAVPAGAQDDGDAPTVRWPALPHAARGADGFAPPGWVVRERRTGDLDGDGRPDLLMILQQRAAANVLRGTGGERFDTNPRLLVVARGVSGGYRLLLSNRTLIPRHLHGNLDDPFGDSARLVIRRGSFIVPLHLFANMGGWTTFERDFTFRIVGGRAVLIGFDEQRTQRNTGEMVATSINYLTGARLVATGSVEDDRPAPPIRTSQPRRPLLTIEQVGDGMAFEPR